MELIYPENLKSKIDDAINFIKDDAEEDFWGREFVDMHTLLTARKVLKEAFAPGGIPSNILKPVMKKLDKWVTEPLLKYSKWLVMHDVWCAMRDRWCVDWLTLWCDAACFAVCRYDIV